MNWIHGFELMCYILSLILIIDMIHRKDISELKIFLSGCIAGFALELLAVRVTDIYYYNPSFWLNLGSEPYQFPVFGGLMWGGLTVCALRLAERLKLERIPTACVTGFLIVSMDLLLDVAAIRLDGGFWTWEGRSITTEVTHHMFMSVIWVNFLGYMFETPMVTWLSLHDRAKKDNRPTWKHILIAVLNAFGGIGFVGVMSLLALWLNSITDEWFSCIAFIIVWSAVLIVIVKQILCSHIRIVIPNLNSRIALLFFLAMYVYCFAGLGYLHIFKERPWLLVLGVILCFGTLLLGIICIDTDDNEQRRNMHDKK